MRRLLTGYAVSFSKRHRRHGQLFQNRYKSIICQEDAYLQELVRYIHLNPLRAKIVMDLGELDKYGYCGHCALMGNKEREWQEVEYVLGYFGNRVGDAGKKYRSYVEKGIEQGRRPELVGGGLIRSLGGWDAVKKTRLKGQDRIKSDQRILGGGDFVNEVLSESEKEFSLKYMLKSLGYDFERVSERVSEIFQLNKEYITGRGRQRDRVMARDVLCYWSATELRMSIVDIARNLDLTPAAISVAVQRGEEIVKAKKYQIEE